MTIGYGLGAAQWTFDRTQTLLDCYKEVCGNNNFPTESQCILAENLCIARELEGSYIGVYTRWENDKNGSNDAYLAGNYVCIYYEKPRVDTSDTRGKKQIE